MPSGGGLARGHMANDDNIDMGLLFAHNGGFIRVTADPDISKSCSSCEAELCITDAYLSYLQFFL